MPTDPYDKQYKPTKKNLEAVVKHIDGLTRKVGQQKKRMDKMECTLEDLCGKMGRFEADRIGHCCRMY